MNYQCHSYSDKTWRHTCIYITPENWDRIKFLSASSGLKTSAWIMKQLKEYGEKVPAIPQREGGCSKSICVEEQDWEIVKRRAELCGMSTSQYVRAVLLEKMN